MNSHILSPPRGSAEGCGEEEQHSPHAGDKVSWGPAAPCGQRHLLEHPVGKGKRGELGLVGGEAACCWPGGLAFNPKGLWNFTCSLTAGLPVLLPSLGSEIPFVALRDNFGPANSCPWLHSCRGVGGPMGLCSTQRVKNEMY